MVHSGLRKQKTRRNSGGASMIGAVVRYGALPGPDGHRAAPEAVKKNQ